MNEFLVPSKLFRCLNSTPCLNSIHKSCDLLNCYNVKFKFCHFSSDRGAYFRLGGLKLLSVWGVNLKPESSTLAFWKIL